MSHASTSTLLAPKVAITRAWTDLAPKLLAFLTGGTAATVIVGILHTYAGVDLDPALAGVIVVVVGTILGYFVKDKAPVLIDTTGTTGVPVVTNLVNTEATQKAVDGAAPTL